MDNENLCEAYLALRYYGSAPWKGGIEVGRSICLIIGGRILEDFILFYIYRSLRCLDSNGIEGSEFLRLFQIRTELYISCTVSKLVATLIREVSDVSCRYEFYKSRFYFPGVIWLLGK